MALTNDPNAPKNLGIPLARNIERPTKHITELKGRTATEEYPTADVEFRRVDKAPTLTYEFRDGNETIIVRHIGETNDNLLISVSSNGPVVLTLAALKRLVKKMGKQL
jgi:hypothetical protein